MGEGTMQWENGITYTGGWLLGLFHGVGSKTYSRGGGYSGSWVSSQRTGTGTQFYSGKFGYDRWTGPFTNDSPHGKGDMRYADGREGIVEFSDGKVVEAASSANHYDGQLEDFDDGSPSTVGVEGHYSGGFVDGKPHGFGKMSWTNGIEYKGMWREGFYHGHGRKLYSRGGGYEGNWFNGKREGSGISFYNNESLGRHGILRWEGPFVDNLAHGVGQAYVANPSKDELNRWAGDTAVAGPRIIFKRGQPVDFP